MQIFSRFLPLTLQPRCGLFFNVQLFSQSPAQLAERNVTMSEEITHSPAEMPHSHVDAGQLCILLDFLIDTDKHYGLGIEALDCIVFTLRTGGTIQDAITMAKCEWDI
jgi:hypothetical protein